MAIQRGDVCLVNFGSPDGNGNLQAGFRPAVIVQNNVGNHYSPVTMVCPLTKQLHKAPLPTHVFVGRGDGGLREDSLILAEQIRSINQSQIHQVLGSLSESAMSRLDQALMVSLGVQAYGNRSTAS